MSTQKNGAAAKQAPPKRQGVDYIRLPAIVELLTAAAGRWIAILNAAGLPSHLLDGRGHSCIKCGGRDRFAAWFDAAQRGAVHCRRCFTKGSDPKPGDGLATLRWLFECDTPTACRWLAQYLGIPGQSPQRPQRRAVVRSIRLEPNSTTATQDFTTIAARCHGEMKPLWWQRLSNCLNLPADVLIRLRVGWFAEKNAMTWPMVNAEGNVVGIRLRCLNTGRKWAVRGGRAGLFVADGLHDAPERLFIPEGPTDTAAVLSVGLSAIGRAAATGSVLTECKTVRRIGPIECVIVADRDDAGRRGAATLAVPLMTCCRSVRIVTPPEPYVDIREWVAAGATAADITAAADSVKPRCLTICSGVTS